MVCLREQPPERTLSLASSRESISLLAPPSRRAFPGAGRGAGPLEREAPATGGGLGSGPARGLHRPCPWRGGPAQERSRGAGPVLSGQGGVQHFPERSPDRALAAGQDAPAAVRLEPGRRAAERGDLLAGLCRVRRQPAAGAPARGPDPGQPSSFRARAAGRSHRPRQHGHRGARADAARRTPSRRGPSASAAGPRKARNRPIRRSGSAAGWSVRAR